MGVGLIILVASLVAIALVALALGVRARRTNERGRPAAATTASAKSTEIDPASQDGSDVDLATMMADAAAALYIPIDSDRRYLAVSHPEVQLEGRTSSVPAQLARAAVAGQSGLEALIQAGRLTGRVVVVDPTTAKAIKAGTMVTDKAGEMIGIIRSSGGTWSGLTRIKPITGSLVKGATAGPAMLNAIAMQAQLAQVERTIGEVRDAVNAVKGHIEAAREADVLGRRRTLASVYRTAQETGKMTPALWNQIQGLEPDLQSDVTFADRFLAQTVGELEQGAVGRVGPRLKWLDEVGAKISSAVAGAADARRSLVQFSILRLWWLAVIEDPSLASRESELRELLAELPDHADERTRTERVLGAAGHVKVRHRLLAPRRHKEVAPTAQRAELEMHELPWSLVDVQRLAELEP